MKHTLIFSLTFALAVFATPAMSETMKTVHSEAHPAVRSEQNALPVTRKLDTGALNTQPIPPGHGLLGSGASTPTKSTAAKPKIRPHWNVSANSKS